MKLLRWGPKGAEKPGLLDADGKIRALSGVVGEIAGAALSDAALDRPRGTDTGSLPEVPAGTPIGPCVAGTATLTGIGLNHADHAVEAGRAGRSEAVIVPKADSAIHEPV